MASSSQIKPGEKGSITVSVNVQHYSGAVAKEISVYSNDPVKPRAMLRLKAEIKRSVPEGR
jgi:hypothetical protein